MMTDVPSTITTTPTAPTSPSSHHQSKSNNPVSSQKAKKASKRQVPQNIERMFETFHQNAKGDFKPTFYNPFEIKHRRRTTKAQYRILESAFKENNKPSASARKVLACKLGMTPRAVQVWFQNRRAKCKGNNDGSDSMGTLELLEPEEGDQLNLEMHHQFEQPRSVRQRTASISNSSINKQTHNISSGRRHSMPDIGLTYGSADASLPFRELHEAIFGKDYRGEYEFPSYSQPTLLPSIAEAYSHQTVYDNSPTEEADVTSAPPAAIMPMIKTRPRKSSVSSNSSDSLINPFLNPNFSTAHIHPHFPHEGQYLGQLDSANNSQPVDPSMSFDSLLNPSLQGSSSAEQVQLNASLPYLDSILMSSAAPEEQASSSSVIYQFNHHHKDMTTPSLSAPNSSPALLPDDHHLQLMQLQSAIAGLHPTSNEMIEAMASRMSPTITPLEMEMILQNAAALNHGKKHSLDSPINPNDFFTDLAVSLYPQMTTIDPANPSNEMLVCMNHPHAQYLGYSLSYADNSEYV